MEIQKIVNILNFWLKADNFTDRYSIVIDPVEKETYLNNNAISYELGRGCELTPSEYKDLVLNHSLPILKYKTTERTSYRSIYRFASHVSSTINMNWYRRSFIEDKKVLMKFINNLYSIDFTIDDSIYFSLIEAADKKISDNKKKEIEAEKKVKRDEKNVKKETREKIKLEKTKVKLQKEQLKLEKDEIQKNRKLNKENKSGTKRTKK